MFHARCRLSRLFCRLSRLFALFGVVAPDGLVAVFLYLGKSHETVPYGNKHRVWFHDRCHLLIVTLPFDLFSHVAPVVLVVIFLLACI
jgi:hypothetical protein